MLRTIEMYTNEYKDTTQKEIRKKKGQFFTPAEVSMRMAAVESIQLLKLGKSVNHIMQNVSFIMLIKTSYYGNPPIYTILSYAILHI